jgi:hypothetical protein
MGGRSHLEVGGRGVEERTVADGLGAGELGQEGGGGGGEDEAATMRAALR